MDFLGGALPNVMFIVGILAVGLGLGIELKLVPLNKEINRGGRIGAFLVGLVLIAVSIVMYRNPALVPQQSATATGATAVSATTTAPMAASLADVVNSAPPATQAALPAAQDVANTAPPATPEATPTAIATAAPGINVPDLHGLDDKGAQRKLQEVGLQAHKVDACSGTDHGDSKAKKGRVQCQNPAAGVAVGSGTTVEYVLAGK
ncbi:MAG TPA: PASTA domain-containing protein [Roseiflexaceae bacterium]|jgi:hypothetical protein|nr:PASTA domain-containing protein [Roseiflexaceae bacterium]